MIGPHPSGVGVYISPPTGVHFRIIRDPAPVEDIYTAEGEFVESLERDVLKGFITTPRKFLDWDCPTGEEVTYQILISETGEDDTFTLANRGTYTFTLTPKQGYSVLQDGDTFNTPNPRDILKLFFSVKLAELCRVGAIRVKNPGHRAKFPVTTNYQFPEANLPVMSIDLAQGNGGPADIGWGMTESQIKLGIIIAALEAHERDQISMAMVGLMREVDWLLDDLGMINTQYGEMEHGIQHSDPPLYLLNLAVACTGYTYPFDRNVDTWEPLPGTSWVGLGSVGIIYDHS